MSGWDFMHVKCTRASLRIDRQDVLMEVATLDTLTSAGEGWTHPATRSGTIDHQRILTAIFELPSGASGIMGITE